MFHNDETYKLHMKELLLQIIVYNFNVFEVRIDFYFKSFMNFKYVLFYFDSKHRPTSFQTFQI